MRNLSRKLVQAVLLLCVITPGCGGGGSSTPSRSVFAGSWSGPYSGTISLGGGVTGQQTGILSATIDSNGKFTGGLQDTSGGGVPEAVEPMTGTINSAGVVTASVVTGDANVSFTISGTVQKNTAGHLTGTLAENVNNSPFGSVTIDIAPTTAAQ